MSEAVRYPERSYTYPDPFAAVTEEVSRLLRELPRAAKELWEEFRRNSPPGVPTEFNIEDLAKKLDYTPDWLKKALNRLIDSGLVECQRRSWRGWVRLIVRDPGIEEKTSKVPNKNPKVPNKNPEKKLSNIDSVVVQDPKILEKTETVPTHHPVENKREWIDPTPQQSPDQSAAITADPTAETAFREVEAADIQLNSTIKQMVIATIAQSGAAALDRIRNAAAVAAAAPPIHKKTGKTTNRAALFVKALKKGWKPRTKGDTPVMVDGPEPLPAAEPHRSLVLEQPKVPEGFNEWFDLARSIGLVISSTWDDEMKVFTISGECESWEEMRRLHPLSELQELAAARNGTS